MITLCSILIFATSLNSSGIEAEIFDIPISLVGSSEEGFADFYIDFDSDGEPELMFEHVSRFSPNHVDLYTDPGSNAEVLVTNGNHVTSLAKNVPVSLLMSDWKNNSSGFLSSANKLHHNFVGDRRSYIACRFPIEGLVHYGWVEISVPDTQEEIVIYGYGYSTIPGKPVLTGQTTPIFNSIPICDFVHESFMSKTPLLYLSYLIPN